MAYLMAFAGSNSSNSINYQLVKYTVGCIQGQEIQLLNMANFPLPMYSEDYEKSNGFANSLGEFRDDLAKADGLILSVNEHNGNPSAYFKNLLDWLSRLERNFLANTPVLLMATSPGKRGGIGALEKVGEVLPRFGAASVVTFSLPSFYDNFDAKKGILDQELSEEHVKVIATFMNSVAQ